MLALSFPGKYRKIMITIIILLPLSLTMVIYLTKFWPFAEVYKVLRFWTDLKVNFQAWSIREVLYAWQTLRDRLNNSQFILGCIHLTGNICFFLFFLLISLSFCLGFWFIPIVWTWIHQWGSRRAREGFSSSRAWADSKDVYCFQGVDFHLLEISSKAACFVYAVEESAKDLLGCLSKGHHLCYRSIIRQTNLTKHIY
jgi:hypothetical protein